MWMSALALALNTPAVGLLMVRAHVATLPLTTGVAHVLLSSPGAGVTSAVMLPKVIGAPEELAVTFTLKVWGRPTGFTPSGSMVMLALTHSLRRLSGSV